MPRFVLNVPSLDHVDAALADLQARFHAALARADAPGLPLCLRAVLAAVSLLCRITAIHKTLFILRHPALFPNVDPAALVGPPPPPRPPRPAGPAGLASTPLAPLVAAVSPAAPPEDPAALLALAMQSVGALTRTIPAARINLVPSAPAPESSVAPGVPPAASPLRSPSGLKKQPLTPPDAPNPANTCFPPPARPTSESPAARIETRPRASPPRPFAIVTGGGRGVDWHDAFTTARSKAVPLIFSRLPSPRFIAAALVLLAASTLPAAAGRLQSALPDDTVVLLHVPDVPALLRQLDASPLGAFYRDPAAAEFFRPLRTRLERLQRRLDPGATLAPGEILNFFTGELVVAALPPADGNDALQWAVLFDHGADPRLTARLRQGFVTAEGDITRRQHAAHGATYQELRVVREEEAAIPVGKSRTGAERITGSPIARRRRVVEQVYEYAGDAVFIHLRGERGWMEGLLRRHLRAEAAPAVPPPGLLEGLPAEPPLVRLYANGAALGRWWRRQIAEANGDFNLEPLRLEDLRALVADLRIAPDRLRLDGFLHAPAPRGGLARLLFLPDAAAVPMADRAPAAAAAYSEMQVPLAAAWAFAWPLFGAIAPDAQRAIAGQLRGVSLRSGIDFEQDLIGRLGSQLVRYLPPAPDGATPAPVCLVRVTEGEVFGPALQRFLTAGAEAYGSFFVEQVDVGGRPLVTLFAGRPDVTIARAARPLFHFTWEPELWAFSLDGAALRRELERWNAGASDTLAAAAEFQRARRALTLREPIGFDYARLPALTRLLEGARSTGRRGGSARMERQLVDERAAPTEAVWGRYLGPFGASRRIEEDRLVIQAALLFSP
ncbi:MAG TPA: hypothetical protein PLS90_09960 [Candidatus Sumerlaeota bacterium]|nr:hypothetical protein [Candidatus Sumerlaeota bacterium]